MSFSIANVSPADSSAVAALDPLSFDVTSSAAILRVIVCVDRPGPPAQAPEMAHDGDAFQPGYESSTRDAISGGYHFVLRKAGGWHSSPSPLVFAFDVTGEEL